jgi:hypothetical protein
MELKEDYTLFEILLSIYLPFRNFIMSKYMTQISQTTISLTSYGIAKSKKQG